MKGGARFSVSMGGRAAIVQVMGWQARAGAPAVENNEKQDDMNDRQKTSAVRGQNILNGVRRWECRCVGEEWKGTKGENHSRIQGRF